MKVFLGGTCNESTWRDEAIEMLEVDYFNPVVDDWNGEAQKRELIEREQCDICYPQDDGNLCDCGGS